MLNGIQYCSGAGDEGEEGIWPESAVPLPLECKSSLRLDLHGGEHSQPMTDDSHGLPVVPLSSCDGFSIQHFYFVAALSAAVNMAAQEPM